MKKNVLVLFGGSSNEYEISLQSAFSILKNIDKDLFNIFMVGISKSGNWYFFDDNISHIKNNTWLNYGKKAILSCNPSDQELIVLEEKKIKIDVIFPAVHGKNMEDGKLQGFLDLTKIPYVGCNLITSAICFDKEYTHIVGEFYNIPMNKWFSCLKEDDYKEINNKIKKTIGYPIFIKPANSGSSVGTRPVINEKELKQALDNAFVHDRKVIIEELIRAQEVECAVYGNDKLVTPYLGEIITADNFYDYDSKYKKDTVVLIPANINNNIEKQLKELAQKIYKIFNCKGLSRIDFFVKNNKIIFNEINTLPGFTPISMYPKLMIKDTFTYKELITGLINLAIEKKD